MNGRQPHSSIKQIVPQHLVKWPDQSPGQSRPAFPFAPPRPAVIDALPTSIGTKEPHVATACSGALLRTFLVLVLAFALPGAHAQPVTTAAPGLRLPREVLPVAYAATLTVDPNQATFEGVIEIDVQVDKATDRILLNAKSLTIAEAGAAVALPTAKKFPAKSSVVSADVIQLQFDAPLPVGAARLTLRYMGLIQDVNSIGVFRQQDRELWYAFTQFEPLDARRAFPSFDEPDMKAPWTLTLRVPKGMRAFGNMPVEFERVVESGWIDFTFQRTPPLPSYLIAFAVGDFDAVDGGKAGMKATPVSILTPKGRGAEAAYAAANTGAILAATEKYFGFAYPFPKLDLIAYPKSTFGAAMENPGLITYSARALLARPDELSPGFEQLFIGITAHEIAHMWFGDYVTMAWWDDLWLNESFASWMGTLISHEVRPDFNPAGWRTFQRGRAMESDRLPNARRLRQPVTASGDVQASFDGIAYAKGQTILTMFEAWLGPEKFREGVRRYMAKHAWGNATAEDFFAALAATDDALVPALRGFVERAGVPVLEVALDCTAKPALVVSQRRFVPAGVPVATPERWAFPACFEYGDATKGRETCTLVKDQSQVIPLPVDACPQWVVANRSGIGYFLPELSPALYAALPKAKAVLAPEDYIPLLGDLNLLVNSGAVSYRDALPLAASQANSPDSRVARRAVDLPLQLPAAQIDPTNAKNFSSWVRQNYGERATTMGWLPKPGENADVARLREGLLPLVAKRGDDAVLAKGAQRLAGQWIADRKAVPNVARRFVLEGAAITVRGDEAATLFDGLLTVALNSKDANEREDVLNGLGAFVDPALQQRAFALSLDVRLSPRESSTPLERALKNSAASPAALAWLTRNIDALAARVPRDYQGLWPRWVSAACTDDERVQFVAVFEKRTAGLDGGPRTYRDTLEKIDSCIAAAKVQRASLNAFLATQR